MYNVCNYADDDTACSYVESTGEVIKGLEKVAPAIICFRLNKMKVNGNKFQFIILNRQLTKMHQYMSMELFEFVNDLCIQRN